MKKTIASALTTLISFAIQATKESNFEQYVADNYTGIVEALQTIGDFDLEEQLDTAMLTLWYTAPTEADEITIKNVVQFFMSTISDAWQNFNSCVDACLEAKYGEVDQPSAVDFLNSCLQLDVQ
jgi:hypothetical protein